MSTDIRLGDFIVRPQRQVIELGDESIHITPKAMSVLECLVAANGEPVSRTELFDTVWPGAEVSDDALTKCVGELRKALGDSARESRVIETIPKFGFRLMLPPEPLEEATTAMDEPSVFSLQRPRGWRDWPPSNGMTFIASVAAFAVVFSFPTNRAWLREAGITSFIEAASILTTPYSLERRPGIAVLPFVNISDDKENEYFSDGMSAELINALARTDRLPVIARSSSFQFKGKKADIKEIGDLLGVTHILEGSVRRAGDTIRLTTQLIDTATGAHVWSGAYQSELSDIFALQDEMAASIVDEVLTSLGQKVVPSADESLAGGVMTARHTPNPEAYDLYLKGWEKLKSANPKPIEQAADYFDRAIALDPYYADAWAAKGLALYSLGRPGFGHPHIPALVYPEAIAAFNRALEIDPAHAMATGWLGVTLIANDYRWAEGMQMIERSLAQNPGDAELLSVYALHLNFMQLEGEGRALSRALRLDPYGTVPIAGRLNILLAEGRFLDALALLESIPPQERDGYFFNYQAAVVNLMIGRLNAADEYIQKARRTAHPDDLSLDALEWGIDSLRGNRRAPPFSKQLERMRTERSSFFVNRGLIFEWEDSASMVAAFDLAIEQRLPEMRRILLGRKPPLMPEAEWRRMQDIAGVKWTSLGPVIPRT